MSVYNNSKVAYYKMKEEGKLQRGMRYVLYDGEVLYCAKTEGDAGDMIWEHCKENNRVISDYFLQWCGYEDYNYSIC